MRTLAILPIKSFGAAKQRLCNAVPPGSRQALAQAMFGDVLAALRRCRRVESVVVVTADSQAEAAARADRFAVIRDETQDGQSAAASLGIQHARAAGFDRAVLVPGDAPLVDPAEVDRLLDRCEAAGTAVAVVPDRHGTGTNALVLRPADAIAPAFGPDSLERHVAAAREAGLAHAVEPVRSLGLDVDTPEDLVALADALERRRGAAPLTRGAVRQLERFGRMPEVAEGDPALESAESLEV
jgi:2-phospho-L-lactate guanylyltransferase